MNNSKCFQRYHLQTTQTFRGFLKKARVRSDVQRLVGRFMIFTKSKRAWTLTSEAGWADDGQTIVIENKDNSVTSAFFVNKKKGFTPKHIAPESFKKFTKETANFYKINDHNPDVLDSLRYEVSYFERNSQGKFVNLKRIYANHIDTHKRKDDFNKVVNSFKALR